MINYFFEDVASIENISATKDMLKFIVKNEEKKLGKLSYIFCSDEYLLQINKKYLDHDYYTDVISFDYSKASVVSGDIFISLHRVKENAKQLGISFDKELNRVLAHGLLHFCGYKDKSEQDIKIMREKEDFYISNF